MSKTITTLLPLQYVSPNSVVVSSTVDLTTNIAATVHASFCQTDNGNHLASPAKFRVECQYSDSPSYWFPLSTWNSGTESPANAQILNTASSGVSVLNIDIIPPVWKTGQFAFIRHIVDASPTDLSTSEFVRILKTEAGTPNKVYLEYPTTFNHTDSAGETAYIFNNADRWVSQVNVVSVCKIRVLIDASLCDRTFVAEVQLTSLDS